jgi:hypothetical protein
MQIKKTNTCRSNSPAKVGFLELAGILCYKPWNRFIQSKLSVSRPTACLEPSGMSRTQHEAATSVELIPTQIVY